MKDIYGTRLPWPLVLALFMMISQQLSGINAGGVTLGNYFLKIIFIAMFYSTAIFKGAGLKGQCESF